MSVAVGGDSTLKDATGSGCDSTSGKGGPPNGYTTSAGLISPGKSDVFVWQLGTARSPSADPNARVFTQQLSYTPNTWNTTRSMSHQALDSDPVADRPSNYNALRSLKMVAAANGGTADAYFDSYHLDASTPVPSAERVPLPEQHHPQSTTRARSRCFRGSRQAAASMRAGSTTTSPSPPNTRTTRLGRRRSCRHSRVGYPAQLDHPTFPGGVTEEAAVANARTAPI